MQREPALVKVLPRQPGTKEARYAHLLSGDRFASYGNETSASFAGTPIAREDTSERIARLEETVAGLQKELADLRAQVAEFRKQFE